MLTIEEGMKILNKGARKYSREETKTIIVFLTKLAKLQVESQNQPNNEDE